MKEKTFKQKWNLTTLRKIREEFCDGERHEFLCNGSPTFRMLWKEHSKEIVELGLEFSPTAQVPFEFKNEERRILFYHDGNGAKSRIAFLDSEIAKKTKKTKKK